MRMIGGVILALVIALLIGLSVQVLIGQANEEGPFFARVSSVLERQFGLRGEVPPPASAAPARGASERSIGVSLPPEIDAAIRIAAERYAAAAREELSALKMDLREREERRDRESFWTDVRLNTLFMLLGLGVPVLLRRFGAYFN